MTIEIIPRFWHILAIITILTAIWPAMHKDSSCCGSYALLPDFEGLFKGMAWLIGNLVMWLIYFIVV